jgi:hypothetical protein
MNTANLENCKRLFELSGWDEPSLRRHSTPTVLGNMHYLPAYDSGYLIRQLPAFRFSDDGLAAHLNICTDQKEWVASYAYNTDDLDEHITFADTPEDALCLLAIKLFEEGVLKK